MATRKQLIIGDLRGGLNQVDPPLANGPGDPYMEDCRNIEFYAGGLCRKRQGCEEPAGLTYSATAGKLAALFRHTTKAVESATELWCVTDGGGIGRMTASSTTFTNIAAGDALTTAQVQHANAVSLDGMLFVAAKNAQDRLHVWDGTSYRRVGLYGTTTAPTTAEAAGAVTDTRKYRVTYVKKTSSVYDLRSEPSNETGAITLTAEKCTVTKNTSPAESETHWELWASSTATNYATWYKIGEAVVATTTIEDNFTSLSDGSAYGDTSVYRGENALFPSCKYLATDENRLLGACSWESDSYASRVFFSAVLGALDVGDAERTPNSVSAGQKYYVDVARGVDGGIVGIAGPLADAIYVFKMSSIWKLVKTGVAGTPYRVVNVHRNVGAVCNKSIVLGEDESGQPALYFLSRRGPYRISTRGLEYLGSDIETTYATINLDADTVIAHSVYHHKKHQVWWWIATGTNDTPSALLVYDTHRGRATELGVRGGWVLHDGLLSTKALCSVMYSKDLGVTNTSLDLKPYFGRSDVNSKLILADKDSVYFDYDGTGYTSYFRTRAYAMGQLDKWTKVADVAGIFKPNSTSSPCLWVRAEQNWQTTWAEYHLSVPPSDNTRVFVESPEATSVRQGPANSDLVSLYLYDNLQQEVGWQLDLLVVGYTLEGER